jgi:hypothetical protein
MTERTFGETCERLLLSKLDKCPSLISKFKIVIASLSGWNQPHMETRSNSETAETISQAHLEYMKQYIRHEEERSRAAVERFLAGKLQGMAGAAKEAVAPS